MHMTDALLSVTVSSTMYAASAASIAYSIAKIKKDELSEKKIPVMAVMGAFVFAAQMINFTIPGTGSSGHIGGGILLAALLGGCPALLVISTVLIIQCLFFADGGLLALGCNIFNMGIIPCLLVYPFLFKPILKKKFSAGSIRIASVAASIVSLQLGAFSVVLETQASGIAALPFGTFVMLMLPIHLAIGIIEGVITAAALSFVLKIRPEILESAHTETVIQQTVSMRKVITILAIVTVVTGGLLSLFASSYPDGLEWSVEKTAGEAELNAGGHLQESAARIQEVTAFMPEYNFKSAGDEASATGTSLAGIAGGALTFIFAWGTAMVISTVKRKCRSSRGN